MAGWTAGVAAMALAASVMNAGAAAARVPPSTLAAAEARLAARFAARDVPYPPRTVTLVALKREARLELWAEAAGGWRFVRSYLVRAASGGTTLDWLLAVVLLGIAAVHAAGLLDARAPLFVADELGVRLRTGKHWRGLPWTEIDAVEVLPRRRFLRDGSIDVLSGEDPIQVPLSLSTRVTGLTVGDLVDSLDVLAAGRCEVAEINGLVVDVLAGHGGAAPANALSVELARRIEYGELKARPENVGLMVEGLS